MKRNNKNCNKVTYKQTNKQTNKQKNEREKKKEDYKIRIFSYLSDSLTMRINQIHQNCYFEYLNFQVLIS